MSIGPMSMSIAAKRLIFSYVGIVAVVVVLMMVFGLLLRLAQGGWMSMSPQFFYQLLTAHGIGMVGIAVLAGAAILWYFLSQYVELSTGILATNLVLFLLGVVCILGATFIGGYGGLWTFLYPLPRISLGIWSDAAAITYLVGVLIVGVGFLLFFLDVGRAIISRYGSLGRGLGWPQLFGGDQSDAPPPTVVASTMVTIINVAALVVGAAILVMSIINILIPDFTVNPLLAKNMIYIFGHTFINSTIYMSIIAVYEILPRYTGRPWKSTRVFLAAWTAATVMVLTVYPHHLLMDFVMPQWMLWLGQIISYLSGLPVLLVTMVGTLTIIHKSGIKWDAASSLLVLSVFGWAAGVLPAIIDATIVVNMVMHNTMWVPGHFHFYLLLGMIAMAFGFMFYLGKAEGNREDSAVDRLAVWLYAGGGLTFVFAFLLAGKESVPRRWAVHLPEWVAYDRYGAVCAAVVVLAAVWFLVRYISFLGSPAEVAVAGAETTQDKD